MASVVPPELSYKSMTFILYVFVHSRNIYVQISDETLCKMRHTTARLLESFLFYYAKPFCCFTVVARCRRPWGIMISE